MPRAASRPLPKVMRTAKAVCALPISMPEKGALHSILRKASGQKILLDLVGRVRCRVEISCPVISRNSVSDMRAPRTTKQVDPRLGERLRPRRTLRQFQNDGSVGNAMGGLLYISGDPKMTPCNPPETQAFYYTSLFACYGIMLALWQRETRGIGAWIDASVQASMALHEHVAFNYSAEGRVMKRAGSQHQHNAPANLFQCKNGWISLFVTQTHWPLLLKVWPTTIRRSTIPSGSIATCAGSMPTTSMRKLPLSRRVSKRRSCRVDAEKRYPRIAGQLTFGFYEGPAYPSARLF